MRKAFTMLELVFVIVILGIVASIGAEIIVKLYENYLKTASINKTQAQTELVLEQISKRLQNSIRDTIIARKTSDNSKTELLNADNTYNILEWIGKSQESFIGEHNGSIVVPGWSGFTDLESSDTNKSQIKTSGSNLNYAQNIIYSLSYSDINISSNTGDSAVVIFKGQDFNDIDKFGYDGNLADYTYKIKSQGNNILLFKDKNASTIYEQYNLAWTAYAIVPEGDLANDDFNLTLYYNYQPWESERYNLASSKKATLAEHVSSFKFMQFGDTIRLKLCIRSDMSDDVFATCKEKVIF